MYKLIIVDDEMLLRQGIIHMTDWSALDFQVVGEAANGKEALTLIEECEPDLIITDIKMPVMNGIELTRRIKETYPHIEVIVLSSFDDFEYVRDTLKLGAIDYLLKPRMNETELLTSLEKAKQKIHHQKSFSSSSPVEIEKLRVNYFRNLLTKKLYYNSFSKELLSELQKPVRKYQNYELVLLFFERNFTDNDYQPLNHLLNSINQLFSQELGHYCFQVNDKLLVLIINFPENQNLDVIIYPKLMKLVNGGNDLHPWVIRSPAFKSFTDLFTVFQETLKMSDYCFYCQKDRIVEYRPIDFFAMTSINLRELSTITENMDFAKINQMIIETLNNNLENGVFIKPYALKKFFNEMLFFIIHKLAEMGFNVDELNGKKFTFLKEIENSTSYDEVLNSFSLILKKINDYIFSNKNKQYNPTITKVIDYIANNFQEKITLNSLANHFFINKSYLCSLFKKETGVNFNDYLTSLRISKAKELLRTSEYNINTICELVGFSNPSYFGMIFKNSVGMQPSEYRKHFN